MKNPWQVVIVALLVALIGCTGLEPDEPRITDPPPGIHLLADAQVTVTPNGNAIIVSYVVNVLNGGTETCTRTDVRVEWPEQLSTGSVDGNWTGMVSRLEPGQRWQPSGERSIGRTHVNDTLARTLAKDMRVIVTCAEPYSYNNVVMPTVK